jgi:hypothetical protein
VKNRKMTKSKTTSVRFDSDLESTINDWLKINPDFNLSRLINMAVRKFITKKHATEPVITTYTSDNRVHSLTKKALKKHRHMLDKLK